MRSRAAFLTAAAAIACGIVVAGYPLLLSGSGLIIFLGLLGLAAVAAGALRSLTALSVAGSAILIAEYLAALFLSASSFDYLSAAYAVTVLLLIELVDISTSWSGSSPPRSVVADRIAYLVTVLAFGAVVAWLAAIGGTLVNSSLALLILGALGGIAAVGLPLHFARQALTSEDRDQESSRASRA